ncbi:chain-length determining protein [Thalassotalea insulae]|uniref:non-specific protein-tyrosine kinase n=1 Tax=Thalassotalea insulae TaxID=2056778 RepID=A0ABQ6GQ88_9GAMM|nr:polysaccharide biosynthesis tyrosine autokinase [Thalassotalea insulae]GLX78128.1 chain-length determining protein [Thalassotalea insulae]
MNENNKLQQTATSEEVVLKEVLSPLWDRRWKIILLTLLITLVVAVYASLLKSSYRASAILQIGSHKPTNTLSIKDAFNESTASWEQIKTQYELLRSRKFAERVVTRLNLTAHPDFNSGKYQESLMFWRNKSDDKETPSFNKVVEHFQRQLTISPIVDTELVKISFTSYDAELASRVANQIGQTYLQYQDEIHRASKESASQWLVDQLEELGKKLEASEQALQTFREQEGIVEVKGIAGLIESELTELTSSALKASKAVDDLKVTYQYIQKNRGNNTQLAELQEINHNPSYIQLRRSEEQLERKIDELSQRYGPKHPKRTSAEAELSSLRQNIVKQVNEQIFAIEKAYFSSLEKVKAISTRLNETKTEYLRISRLNNKFSQLQREVETNKELYNNYLIRLKETDAMGNYKSNFYVRFIDKAITPKAPVAPNKRLMVLMSFVLSAVLLSLIIIVRELVMDTLNSRRKLDNFQEADILAVLPKFKTTKSRCDNYQTDNRFIEAIRSLRTSLLLGQSKKPPQVIAITSSVPNEGKSTVALELARSFGEMEKVLLIEADMRHPTLYKTLKVDKFRPGLSNLLAKTHQINECIVRDKQVRLDILTSGITPANPLAFLSMKRFNMLIKVFSNFYDRIIIETPPVNAVSDAVIISRSVDSVLYVVHGTKTKREHITSGLRLLNQVDAPVSGVVVNQSENVDNEKYHNKYYLDTSNIIKLPVRKHG